MNNNAKNNFSILLSRIFNKYNFNKVLIIFIVGFVSRVLIGYFYSANVYLDYICMSASIILVHEFVGYFNLNIIPSLDFFYKIYIIIIRILVSMNTIIFSCKLEDIKISSFIKGAKYFFSGDRATLDLNRSYAYKNYNRIIDSNPIKESTYILEKNDKDASKKSLPRGR